MKNLFLMSLIFIFSNSALAWGGRGHHTICEAAVFSLQNEEVKDFLRSRAHVMGHLCNVPDTEWRGLAPELTAEGNPTHFLDSEVIPLPIKDFPAQYQTLVNNYSGKKSGLGQEIKSVPHELGSVWWRADQLYRLALSGSDVLKAAGPDFKLSKSDEQDEHNAYNKAVYNFYVNLGIMGHFVGDNSMPFHISTDYDGYEKSHGGIHVYYEDGIVSQFDESLLARVVKEAKKMRTAKRPEPFLVQAPLIEKMRALSILSYSDIDKILKLDTLLKVSENKEVDGKKVRNPALRESTAKNFKKFEGIALTELARAAALLADLWDQAYVEAGKPNLKAYHSYKFPLSPDFVMPDYYPLKDTK